MGRRGTRPPTEAAHPEAAGLSAEGARTLVAHDEEGVPIGWASTGPPRDEDPPTDTELWSLYLASTHHGSGVARQLLEAALPPSAAAHLWVLDGNDRAVAFYRRMGVVERRSASPDTRSVLDRRAPTLALAGVGDDPRAPRRAAPGPLPTS